MHFTNTGKNNLVLVIFSIILPIMLLLLSYKAVLVLNSMTADQQSVFNFLDGKGELQGFTDSEVSHLQDVKKVMNYADDVFYLLLLFVTLTFTYYKKDRKFMLKLLRYGGISTVSVMFFIFIFVLFSFNSSFTIFHQIFFPQGNWLFPIDSKIIMTFPLEFFISISRNIFLLCLGLGVFTMLVGFFYEKVINKFI